MHRTEDGSDENESFDASEASFDPDQMPDREGACAHGDAVAAGFRATERAEEHERVGMLPEAIVEYETALRELRGALGLLGGAAQERDEVQMLHERIEHCEQQCRRLVDEGQKRERDQERDRKFAQVLNELVATERSYNAGAQQRVCAYTLRHARNPTAYERAPADLRVMEHYREALLESLDRLGPQVRRARAICAECPIS